MDVLEVFSSDLVVEASRYSGIVGDPAWSPLEPRA